MKSKEKNKEPIATKFRKTKRSDATPNKLVNKEPARRLIDKRLDNVKD